jgi:hypothetical protein
MTRDPKDTKRIQDIITKGNGRRTTKALSLANTQANRITDLTKAIRRGNAATDLNAPELAQIFYKRASRISDIPMAMLLTM